VDINQAHSKSDRGLALQTSVARNAREILSLLVLHASPWSLDQGIEVTALRGDWDMVQLLHSRGGVLISRSLTQQMKDPKKSSRAKLSGPGCYRHRDGMRGR